MSILDYFKPVTAWSADEVKAFLQQHPKGDYNLVDVRQLREYDAGHLPGARSIPIGELQERTDELERGKTTIVYCNSGMRSQAAAISLHQAGFGKVIHMTGGMQAWHDLVAKGRPEMAMTWFFPAHSAEEHIALAWYLEEGTRQFYSGLTDLIGDDKASVIYEEMTRAEVNHKAMLRQLYEELSGHRAGENFPREVIALAENEESFMEGGIAVRKALEWCRERPLHEILELTAGMETNAYDRYLFMQRIVGDESARSVFQQLARAEKQHLDLILRWLDELFQDTDPHPWQAGGMN